MIRVEKKEIDVNKFKFEIFDGATTSQALSGVFSINNVATSTPIPEPEPEPTPEPTPPPSGGGGGGSVKNMTLLGTGL